MTAITAHGEGDALPPAVEGEEDVSDLFSGSMPKEEIGALRFLKVQHHVPHCVPGVWFAIGHVGI